MVRVNKARGQRLARQRKLAAIKKKDKGTTKTDEATGASTSSAPTLEQLAMEAQAACDQFDYERALAHLMQARILAPRNTEVMDKLAEVHLELDQAEEAADLLRQSVELAPNDNPAKFLLLAQMMEGNHALGMYEHAIGLMRAMGDQMDPRAVARALSGAAELFLTDLCDEEGAEAKCEQLCQQGLELAPQETEMVAVCASLRMAQERFAEAKQMLLDNVNHWFDEEDDNLIPSVDVRVSIAKLLVDLDDDAAAVSVFEHALESDDTDAEVWFLLGMGYKSLQEWENALRAFEKSQKLLGRLEGVDPGIMDKVAAEVELSRAQAEAAAGADQQ